MGGRALGTVGTNSGAWLAHRRALSATALPPAHHALPQTVPRRAPGAGTQKHVQLEQMETSPLSRQAQGAGTPQEMGPCASLSVSQNKQATGMSRTLCQEAPKPWSAAPNLATWARTDMGRWAPPGVLQPPGPQRVESPGALARVPFPTQTRAPGLSGFLGLGPRPACSTPACSLSRPLRKRASDPKTGTPAQIAGFT